MKKVQINRGDKCFAKTRACRAPLLCTIEEVDVHMVTVRLPCTLKGMTHDKVYIKDIRLKQPSRKVEKPTPAPKNIDENPYRRHLNNILKNPEPPAQPEYVEPDPSPTVGEEKPRVAGDMLEIYLCTSTLEERRKNIMALGDDGKRYHHLL